MKTIDFNGFYHRSITPFSLLLAAVILCFGFHPVAKADQCTDLENLVLTFPAIDTGLIVASEVTSATNEAVNPMTGATVPHCKITGYVRTQNPMDASDTSDIGFRFRLPDPVDWNGRFWMSVTGGHQGDIDFEDQLNSQMFNLHPNVGPLEQGFAVGNSDVGHKGNGPTWPFPDAFLDMSWALETPANPGVTSQKEINKYENVGLHLATVAGKQILNAFYGANATYSYYGGCSNAGFHGLRAAARYPADFDGVVVGNPQVIVVDSNGATFTNAGDFLPDMISQKALANVGYEPGDLTTSDLALVHSVVLDKCDLLDGIADGIISSMPGVCQIKAQDLPKCPSNDPCLTSDKINAVISLFSDKTVKKPDMTIVGLAPGSEENWDLWTTGNIPFPIIEPNLDYNTMQNLLRYVLRDDPFIALSDYFNDNSINEIYEEYLAALGSTHQDNDLSAFKARGGKIILFNTLADPNVGPQNVINFYNSIRSYTGGRSGTEQFVRLFLVPGLGHCGGSTVGVPEKFDSEPLIMDWVENSVAPDSIDVFSANGYTNSRLLCPYPEEAVVIDPNGDVWDSANFKCVDMGNNNKGNE